MIKSAKDVIAVARERGFGLRVDPGPPPMPFLVNTRGEKGRLDATDVLMNALKVWRLDIIAELQGSAAT